MKKTMMADMFIYDNPEAYKAYDHLYLYRARSKELFRGDYAHRRHFQTLIFEIEHVEGENELTEASHKLQELMKDQLYTVDEWYLVE